jgi:hypothetical protein
MPDSFTPRALRVQETLPEILASASYATQEQINIIKTRPVN